MKITQSKEQAESQMKKKKSESNIRDLWDNIKRANLCIMGIPEGEEREKGIENVFKGDFPGGAVVKNPPANAGDTGSSPGLGRSHMPWSN